MQHVSGDNEEPHFVPAKVTSAVAAGSGGTQHPGDDWLFVVGTWECKMSCFSGLFLVSETG